MGSPFKPGFGKFPPAFAGREPIVHQFDAALRRGQADGFLVRGHRGMGKTVLLSALEDRAREHGWVTVSAHCYRGFYSELVDTIAVQALHDLSEPSSHRKISGLSVAGVGGITTTAAVIDTPSPTLYTRLNDIFQALHKRNDKISATAGGIVLTIDEVESHAVEDLTKIAASVQRLVRENRPLIVVMAGLPHLISQLVSSPHMTFLRRAHRIDIGPLSWDSARLALVEPFAWGGKEIRAADLDAATAATHGYPYLTQVIGDTAWNLCPAGAGVTSSIITEAISTAMNTMGQQIHEPALTGLSERQLDYVHAVAEHGGECTTKQVALTLGITESAAANIRAKLQECGVLYQPARGQIAFTIPYLADYLHADNPDVLSVVPPREFRAGP